MGLAGALDNAAQYLRAFDLFVLPSVKEGMPYAVLEALAAGLPIIMTSAGETETMENISGNRVAVVAPRSPEALAHAIGAFREHTAAGGKKTEQAVQELGNAMLEKTFRLYRDA